MDWRRLLFSYKGRINRAKYWLGFLIQIGISTLVVLVFITINVVSPLLGGICGLILFAVVIWSWFAINTKRLHDRDKSGWFLLVFWGLPLILGTLETVAQQNDNNSLQIICALGETAIGIWMFIELGCLRGTPGTNRFGPDPLGSPVPAGTGPAS